jgi:CheY-like chemotaxis protein
MKLNKFTILYVEDSKVLREYVKDMLKEHAKEVYVASDGKKGIEVFSKVKPDIVM